MTALRSADDVVRHFDKQRRDGDKPEVDRLQCFTTAVRRTPRRLNGRNFLRCNFRVSYCNRAEGDKIARRWRSEASPPRPEICEFALTVTGN